MKLKIGVAAICVLLGLAVAGVQAFQAHWLSSITALILGPTVGFIFLLGYNASRDSPLIRTLAGLAVVLGVMTVFFEHRAFDVRRTEAHTSVLAAFVEMELACPIMDTSLRDIQRKGIMACALQDNSDQIGAIAELQKARTFGPTASLADSVHSAVQPRDVDQCAEAFRAARPRCPSAFASVATSSQELLLAPN
jgi:hypothetical protein